MTTARSHQFVADIEISSAVYGLVQRFDNAGEKLSSVFRTWAKRSEDRRQLAQMSDRMLADIGLNRGDVVSEVDKFFWQL